MSSPSLSHLRCGIIGTGFIGPVHLEAVKRLGARVTAVCGSTKSARALAERWGVPEVYGDYDYRALLASPNVDVVHITSPNRVHVEQSLAALAAGKHVICEKPLGMTTAETAKLVRAAERSGLVFAVNYMCRFFPAVLQMRAMVRRGELGRIVHVQGHFFQDWLLKPTDYNWRVLASEGGKLRAVGDIGTHWIDTLGFILGDRVESVFATLGRAHEQRLRPKGEVQTFTSSSSSSSSSSSPAPVGEDEDEEDDDEKPTPYQVDTEDFASVLLRYGGGTHANLAVSQVAAGWKCSLYLGLYGTEGSVRWELQQPNELLVGRRDEPNQILQRATAGFSEDIAGFTDYPGGHPEGFADAHKMHYRAVYQHIASGQKGAPLFATAADGHEEIRVCEAILESDAGQRWVKLGV